MEMTETPPQTELDHLEQLYQGWLPRCEMLFAPNGDRCPAEAKFVLTWDHTDDNGCRRSLACCIDHTNGAIFENGNPNTRVFCSLHQDHMVTLTACQPL